MLDSKNISFLLILLATASCGRPSQEAVNVANGMIPVASDMAFTTKCPVTGTLDAPTPALLGLWDCPMDTESLELVQPPQPFILQADCKKKTLQVMSADMRSLVSEFYIQLDGKFDIVLDPTDFSNGNEIVFASDHSGRGGACSAHPQLNVWGSIKCSNRDHAKMDINARWNFGQGELPENLLSSERRCEIPRGCYFYSSAEVSQCS